MINVGHIVVFKLMISWILHKIIKMKKVLWKEKISDKAKLVKSVIPQILKWNKYLKIKTWKNCMKWVKVNVDTLETRVVELPKVKITTSLTSTRPMLSDAWPTAKMIQSAILSTFTKYNALLQEVLV